jgi:hypothetical protein
VGILVGVILLSGDHTPLTWEYHIGHSVLLSLVRIHEEICKAHEARKKVEAHKLYRIGKYKPISGKPACNE